MANWVVQNNHIYRNNLSPNPAPPDSFQAALPPGVGVLLLGVSDHVVSKNRVEDNGTAGIGLLGWCTAVSIGDPADNCINDRPRADPAVSNNEVALNTLVNNGNDPEPGLEFLAADLLYFVTIELPNSNGNCFEKNRPSTATEISFLPSGELPTDGC